MPRRFTLTLTLALTALAAAGAGAQIAAAAPAKFFPADPVDGPSADIVKLSDVDVARDGSGAMAYLKREGGVAHVFVSRLVNGVWQPPERIDVNTAVDAADPVVGASDGGRLVIAYVAGGQLFTVVRPGGTNAWPAPIAGPAPAATPDVDMSINGVAYLVWAGGGDVHAARLERNGTSFTALPAPLDIDPAATAGDGNGRPKIAIAADGIATVAWGESGHVYARRLFELRLSTAPQRLDVDSFENVAGGTADLPDLDSEDDSSFGWVVFRESFTDGRDRVLARRLRGSLFDDPVDVGPAGEGAAAPRIDLNGRGQGLVGSQGSAFAPFADSLQLDVFSPVVTLGGPSAFASQPQPAVAEGGDGVVAWMEGASADTAIVKARAFDNGKTGVDATLSNRDLGPVDPDGGFDAASNRAGDIVVAFVQGSGDQRRIVSGTYDRAPGAFVGTSHQKWRNTPQPKLSWGASFELWGPAKYTVTVDGATVGETTETGLTPAQPIADGEHKWQVVATDRRGQVTRAKSRILKIDAQAPALTLSTSGTRRAGETIAFTTTASDAAPVTASGMKSVALDFGDGTKVAAGSGKHVFERGTYTITATATDKAGNVTTVTKRLKIAKAKKK